jgi:hypothetical protein
MRLKYLSFLFNFVPCQSGQWSMIVIFILQKYAFYS